MWAFLFKFKLRLNTSDLIVLLSDESLLLGFFYLKIK